MLQGFQNKFVVIYNRYLGFPHVEKSKISLMNAMVCSRPTSMSAMAGVGGECQETHPESCYFGSKICAAEPSTGLTAGTSVQQQDGRSNGDAGEGVPVASLFSSFKAGGVVTSAR
jgi:hypothetical protein